MHFLWTPSIQLQGNQNQSRAERFSNRICRHFQPEFIYTNQALISKLTNLWLPKDWFSCVDSVYERVAKVARCIRKRQGEVCLSGQQRRKLFRLCFVNTFQPSILLILLIFSRKKQSECFVVIITIPTNVILFFSSCIVSWLQFAKVLNAPFLCSNGFTHFTYPLFFNKLSFYCWMAKKNSNNSLSMPLLYANRKFEHFKKLRQLIITFIIPINIFIICAKRESSIFFCASFLSGEQEAFSILGKSMEC